MSSNNMLQTELYCPQCGEDKPADQLEVLFARYSPDGELKRVGRFCLTCMPGEISMELTINHAIETKTFPFTPTVSAEKII